MAWTTPRTWVTSETVTSTIMNTHVRDNLLEVYRVANYAETASTVSTTTHTEAAPLDVVSQSVTTTSSSQEHIIEVGIPFLSVGRLSLWRDSTDLGRIAADASGNQVSQTITFRSRNMSAFALGAGTYTYKARIWTSGGTNAQAIVTTNTSNYLRIWIKG